MPDRAALETEEIEVTPEMIAAGIDAYCACNFALDDFSEIVEAVYTAMRSANRLAPLQEDVA